MRSLASHLANNWLTSGVFRFTLVFALLFLPLRCYSPRKFTRYLIMIGFILCSVSLAALVQNQNQFLQLLATPVALGIGLTIMAASLLAGYFKKVSHRYLARRLCDQRPVGLVCVLDAAVQRRCADVLFLPAVFRVVNLDRDANLDQQKRIFRPGIYRAPALPGKKQPF